MNTQVILTVLEKKTNSTFEEKYYKYFSLQTIYTHTHTHTHTHMDTKLSFFWRSTDIRGENTDVKLRILTMNENKGKMWS